VATILLYVWEKFVNLKELYITILFRIFIVTIKMDIVVADGLLLFDALTIGT